MKQSTKHKIILGLLISIISLPSFSHDPVFGIGPHVLFKGGTQLAIETHQSKTDSTNTDKKETELGLEIIYGITGDWAAGFELPYMYKEEGATSSNGLADVQLFTKYRFWRKDAFGQQDSAAVMFSANLNNGDETATPKLGNGANDFIGGLTYGFESLTWYRWASVRYRLNGRNDTGLKLGNKTLIDFVIGWRPTLPEYKNPDTVWLLELNNEFSEKSEANGSSINNSGGFETFLSPGIFWTIRNFAIKAGVQIPIYNNLNGIQNASDFRAKASFELHL